MRANGGQVAGEQVHVEDVADHPVGLIPVRIILANGVQRLQFIGAGDPQFGGPAEKIFQVIEKIVVTAIKRVQQPEEPGEVALQPGGVGLPVGLGHILEARPQPGHQSLK